VGGKKESQSSVWLITSGSCWGFNSDWYIIQFCELWWFSFQLISYTNYASCWSLNKPWPHNTYTSSLHFCQTFKIVDHTWKDTRTPANGYGNSINGHTNTGTNVLLTYECQWVFTRTKFTAQIFYTVAFGPTKLSYMQGMNEHKYEY
jgi:hypothetical protein